MKTHFFMPKTYFLPDFGFEGVACSTLPPCKHENERKKFWGKNVKFFLRKENLFRKNIDNHLFMISRVCPCKYATNNTILKTMNITKSRRKKPFSLKLSSKETETFAKRVIADYERRV